MLPTPQATRQAAGHQAAASVSPGTDRVRNQTLSTSAPKAAESEPAFSQDP